MKKLIIFAVIVCLCGCQKEVTVVETNEIENISIESLTQFLPLTNGTAKTKAVFYNDKGEEITFDFKLEENLEEKIIDSKTYKTEEISARYTNDTNKEYFLYFTGFGNYVKVNEPPVIAIFASIRQSVEPVSSLLTLDDTGAPILGMYYESKQLLDKEFKNVYSNFITPEINAFGELYYNASFGIIGFKDREGELYVFKEYLD